jgi:ribosomal protein S18 acetylase RimI-like enzyme
VIIRPVSVDETAALSGLASRAYAETFGASMSREDLEVQLRATRSENYFRSALMEDVILVAVIDGAIVGYVQLSDVRIPIEGAEASDQELFALYVRSDLQGQGVGKALMDAAFLHERLKRARNVWLDVWDENARAIGLYTRYGFKPAGRRDFVVDGRVVGSDLVMVLQRT